MNDVFSTDSISQFAATARRAKAGIGVLVHTYKATKDRTVVIYAAEETSDFEIVNSLVKQLAGDDE